MFHIHRAERADGLVDTLGKVVSAPLTDPFQAEVVAVPTRGVERWLTQRLSAVLGTSPGHADGVCANVEFPFPGRLVNWVPGSGRAPALRDVMNRVPTGTDPTENGGSLLLADCTPDVRQCANVVREPNDDGDPNDEAEERHRLLPPVWDRHI